MAPLWTPSSESLFAVDNWGTNPSSAPGTSVVPGASNAEGTFTQLLTALAQECQGFYITVSEGATSANAKNHLLDIGIDPAGGSSYTAIISNIVCGSSNFFQPAGSQSGGGHRFFFPMRLPAGATVAARVQGSNATAGTVRIGIRAYGQPSAPWLLPVWQYSETLGTITNSNGVSFTPGNAADGTWVSLGTTTRDLWWFQLGYQIDNGTVTAEFTWIELGAGGSGTQRVLLRRAHAGSTAEAVGDGMGSQTVWHEGYHPIESGTELWIRGRCNNAPDTGYNGVSLGVGG